MAFCSIISRGMLRTSREILERNYLGAGVLATSHPDNVNLERSRLSMTHHRNTTAAKIAYVSFKNLEKYHGGAQSIIRRTKTTSAVGNATRGYYEKTAAAKARFEAESDSDSDDEFERKRCQANVKMSERGDSAFWRRKIRTLHKILDVNRDGVISFEDFQLLTTRFTDLGHLSPRMSDEFFDVMKQTWIELFGEISPYNTVQAEQFLTDIHHRLNDKKMEKQIARFLPYIFKAVDYDHTGHLDLDQYKLFFRCLGLSDEDAAVSFAVIDHNGDGQVSMKEFVHLGRQFFLTEDETKISRMFWGPLIDH